MGLFARLGIVPAVVDVDDWSELVLQLILEDPLRKCLIINRRVLQCGLLRHLLHVVLERIPIEGRL